MHLTPAHADLGWLSLGCCPLCRFLLFTHVWHYSRLPPLFFSPYLPNESFLAVLHGILAQTSAQKGILWWAAHHRHIYRYSDEPNDVHSPNNMVFGIPTWSWLMSPEWQATETDRVKDLAKYPELRFPNKHYLIHPFFTQSRSFWSLVFMIGVGLLCEHRLFIPRDFHC